MKKLQIIFLFFILVWDFPGFSQGKQTIAVLPFEVEENLTSLAKTVADRFQTELFRINFFKLVDRNTITALFDEQKLALTGSINSESSVKVGRMLSAQKVLTGSIRTTQSKYFLTVNIIDVETGGIDYSDHLTVQQKNDVLKKIPLMVDRIEEGVVPRTIQGHSTLIWAMWAGELMLTAAASEVAREGGMELVIPDAGTLEECLDALSVKTRPSGKITDELRASIRLEIEQKYGREPGETFQLGWVANLAAFVCGMPPTLKAARHEIKRICKSIRVPENISKDYLRILDQQNPDQHKVLESLALFKKRLLEWLDDK